MKKRQLQFGFAGIARRRSSPGFTLLELLVVIAIIAVLAAMLMPAYQRSMQGVKATACSSNLHQIGVGLQQYLGENNMLMPALQAARASLADNVPVIDNTLDKYLPNKAIFACPADTQGIAAATGTSYYWNVALNNQSVAALSFLNLTTDHSRIPILADKEGFHPYLDNKVNILYADGHATKDLKFWQDSNGN